jgi:drug/metabolite transporter (DMT)-like permease
VLFHGVYLGGVFYSVSIGMPTGIAALIVTLQPLLTNALAGKLLGEKVSFKQWVGVILGFFGAALVLGFDIGTSLPVVGVVASFIALFAITSSTLWQKKISNNLSLSVSNMYQAIGGFTFHIIIIIIFTDPYINFTSTFLIAMSHQIFIVSFGAFTILMFLIKNNSASKTVSIFFLIPPTTAIMAWMFLNEMLTNLDLIGFAIATLGVYVATRKNEV